MSPLLPQQLRLAMGTVALFQPSTAPLNLCRSGIDKKPLSSSFPTITKTTTTMTISGIRSKRRRRWWWWSSPPQALESLTTTRRSLTICMAHPRRVMMVAKQIRRELSEMLITDKVLKRAVLPESSLGADRYLSSLTTITDVEVSRDLQVVKVYVSVFGDERGKAVAIAGLKANTKYVRSKLGKRIKLRLTPEIRFIEDDSIERGNRVIAILDRLKKEREESRNHRESPDSLDSTDNDDEWDDIDPDDGDIIYVK